MTFKIYDVVFVSFPFSDMNKSKIRPSVIMAISPIDEDITNVTVLMLTSSLHQKWPLDLPVMDIKAAGLIASSVCRMKFSTIDKRTIDRKIGRLSERDIATLKTNLKTYFEL